mmetsp:Transcript_43314/g.59199  ORF Transcript_43314/g.59199 Transcript_43314/m.59199 type:complete len:288 (-) Transcript_43314:244-1107(-)
MARGARCTKAWGLNCHSSMAALSVLRRVSRTAASLEVSMLTRASYRAGRISLGILYIQQPSSHRMRRRRTAGAGVGGAALSKLRAGPRLVLNHFDQSTWSSRAYADSPTTRYHESQSTTSVELADWPAASRLAARSCPDESFSLLARIGARVATWASMRLRRRPSALHRGEDLSCVRHSCSSMYASPLADHSDRSHWRRGRSTSVSMLRSVRTRLSSKNASTILQASRRAVVWTSTSPLAVMIRCEGTVMAAESRLYDGDEMTWLMNRRAHTADRSNMGGDVPGVEG